jgi:hypothetical protein
MWNIMLRGNSDARMIRCCLYADTRGTRTYGYERFDGTGGTLTITNFEGVWLNGHPVWLRCNRTGDVYTFYTSGDGLGWVQIAQTTSSIDAETFKISVGQYSGKLGLPMRIDEAVDLLQKGDTDARKAVPAYSKGTTESTTFASLPSWLTLDAQGDGSATLGDELVELATAASDPSRATITYNGTGYENAGLLVSAQRANTGLAYVVFGLAVDDGGSQIDVYSDTPGYVIEYSLNRNSNTSVPVLVRRPIGLDEFNEPYTFLGLSGQPVDTGNYVCWYRIEKYGSRLRMKQWDESMGGEPADWLYDGEVDVLRGVNANNLLKPYVSIAHNPGVADAGAINIFSLEFYELIP